LIVMACCGALLLAIGPVAARLSYPGQVEAVTVHAATPSVQSPWRAVNGHASEWKPTYLGPAAEVLQTYASTDGDVDLYIGYYVDEQQGAELVNSENRLTNDKSWTAVREGKRAIVLDGQTVQVRETTLLSSQGKRRLVWSWYWVADEFTSSPPYAKFLQAKAQLFGGSIGSAVIALASESNGVPGRAVGLLQDFVQRSAPWRETLRGFVGPRAGGASFDSG
jgi:EpsI family protein